MDPVTRPLGTAPSNPRLGTRPLNTHGDEAGDGGAAPSDKIVAAERGRATRPVLYLHIGARERCAADSPHNDWLIAWCALANRIVDWHKACEAEDATLVFDSHDQARLA